jgi:hypothetical protein
MTGTLTKFLARFGIRGHPSESVLARLGQNWQSLGINTVLGYNEPDKANPSKHVRQHGDWSWGDLLGTGLRVGSPATTDGGRSWLASVRLNKPTPPAARGLRGHSLLLGHNPADAAGAANQMYNFLLTSGTTRIGPSGSPNGTTARTGRTIIRIRRRPTPNSRRASRP